LPDVKITPATIVIGLGVVLVGGVFSWLTFGPQPAPPPPPVLTAEARQYLPNLGLHNVRMQAAESFVEQRVVEILGDIVNKGDRKVKLAEVTCVFRNYANQEVHRERSFIVTGVLAPGQTQSFRLAFDDVPETWNQALPTLVIAQVQFE
jgi:hypothetical protein